MPDMVRDETEQYFYPIHYQFLDRYLADMDGSTLKVFMAIARHVRFTNGTGPVSITKIETTSGCCHNTTVKAFAELEKFKILKRIMDPGMCTTYIINQNLQSPQNLVGVKEDNPPQKLGGESPQDLGGTPPKKWSLIEKREEREEVLPNFSPQTGGVSTSKPAQYDFGTFKSFYPRHRMSEKNERASRAEWNSINGDAQTKVAIIQHLSAMVNDPEWTRDQGNWVPTPQKYLAEERWKNELSWAALYRPECQAIVDYFLEVTGQSAAVNKLTEDRLKMLSARIHEAKAMKLEIDPHNERSLMKDAVDSAWNSAYYKKHPEAFTLESVYGSAERFEKLIKREVPA